MFKRIIKKIWNDSVGSNIIAALILAIVTLGYNSFISATESITFKQAFLNFWTYQIKLWVILIVFIVIIIAMRLIKRKFRYDDQTLNVDRNLFDKIRKWDGMVDLVLEIKSHGFSSRPVDMKIIHTMISLREENEKPDFYFFNPILNKNKVNLFTELDNLDSVLSKYIFGANNGFVAIPTEWEYNQPERFNNAKVDIRKQEDAFTNALQHFITSGRIILKV